VRKIRIVHQRHLPVIKEIPPPVYRFGVAEQDLYVVQQYSPLWRSESESSKFRRRGVDARMHRRSQHPEKRVHPKFIGGDAYRIDEVPDALGTAQLDRSAHTGMQAYTGYCTRILVAERLEIDTRLALGCNRDEDCEPGDNHQQHDIDERAS
jgi:hypothetical protein